MNSKKKIIAIGGPTGVGKTAVAIQLALLFNTEIIDGHFLSEDWYFCNEWAKIGGSIFIDVSINLKHTGPEEYNGSFISSIVNYNNKQEIN